MYHLIDYVWCVEKFSQYFEKTNSQEQVYPLLTSPVFAYKNTRWVLNLYPEGLGDQASHGYTSLFVKYVSEDPESINAKVELSLLNNKNERVYCRDTGDHQYQTFIDFGYKQFLKIQDIKDQKDELISNGILKIFARVEFEHSNLPASLTWSNYDLLLFKDNFKDLYETKNLCDIVLKIVKKPVLVNVNQQQFSQQFYPKIKKFKSSNNFDSYPYMDNINNNNNNSNNATFSTGLCNCNCNFFVNDLSDASQGATNQTNTYLETLEIKSHKFILASRSGKFRELLKTNLIKIVDNSKARHLEEGRTTRSYTASSSSNSYMCPEPSCSSSSSSHTSPNQCNCQQCFSTQHSIPSGLLTSCDDITDLLIIETDRSPKVIEYLIRYMYTGYLDTLDTYAKDIYEISKEYKVHGLTNLAREHLIKELNVQNCCDYLIFCVINNDYELNNKIQVFIQENYEQILKTNSYKQAKRKYRELFENTFNEIAKKILPNQANASSLNSNNSSNLTLNKSTSSIAHFS